MALVLLFAQTQATLHWLSHSTAAVRAAQGRVIGSTGADAMVKAAGRTAGPRTPSGTDMLQALGSGQDRTAPRTDPSLDLSCDKCASLASLSAVLPGDVFELVLQAGRDVQVAARAWSSAERILRLGYLSRAPPTAG